MPKKYPPLSPQEVIAILKARGFAYKSHEGSHENYEGYFGGKRRIVTVDMGVDEFWADLMASMIRQCGMSRDQFYCSNKKTAKKINKRLMDFEPESPPVDPP
ncbi:MAG: type II toxin-antitoxin system HicA family toxin [Bacteroidota bacterium]